MPAEYGGACGVKKMGWIVELEPTASGATIQRSNHLSYTHRFIAVHNVYDSNKYNSINLMHNKEYSYGTSKTR